MREQSIILVISCEVPTISIWDEKRMMGLLFFFHTVFHFVLETSSSISTRVKAISTV